MKTIFIVDDTLESLEVLHTLIEKEGTKIITAQSSVEALQMIPIEDLDLILLNTTHTSGNID